MKFEPFENDVVVRRIEKEKTKSGLLMVSNKEPEVLECEVVEVGSANRMKLTPNHKVMIENKHDPIRIQDDVFFVVEDKEILGVYN